jgi:two-component system, chemotaxis family, chemotaxis protein CheY
MSAKILVVDDSSMIRREIGRALSEAGFTVLEAVDGVDATRKVALTRELRLVICDVDMPRMNGIEFVERMNASDSRIPVVMLTTESRPDLIEHVKTLGAKGWIVKPFKPDLLVAVARRLIGAA